MERYSEYKDSGVQWLGEIPGHWKTMRLGILGECSNGVSKSGEYFGEGHPFVSYSDVYKNIELPQMVDGLAKSTEDDRQKYSVEYGDVFFTRTSEKIQEIGFSSTCLKTIPNAVFAGFLIRFRPTTKELIPEFSKYYFRCNNLRSFYITRMNLVTRASLSQSLLRQLTVTLPPLTEQHSIVSYLDDKCGKIDKMLEGKQKQIELLTEMKQRIIADAVTHGLNPNVKMKATNIPWLQEIPEHWDVIRIKWLFKEEDEKNIDLSYQLLSFSRNKGIIPFSENSDKAPSASDLSKYKILHKGQLLENRMQAWSGMFGCSFIEGCVSPDYSVFSPLDRANTEYYAHLFRTPLYVQQFANASKGIGDGFNRLYTPQFQRIYAICPPLSEQRSIVSYITDKTAKIDALTGKLQQEIESIKEYKQRLISDVVTGQIKVC